ncbi:hypothetical protein [Luteolibacter sp. LG18]|uniref:hypothetical protein n=1 Tax=Luteolibacter sp. LG18 TaxID=2819286 RepID=UPI002B2DAFDB|nr:hypothetical protein llg_23680 [Luteolibacter sp. LG18]
MSSESRRNFVKKSLVASILAAQPTIMAGLVRASGGGDETTTAPETTVDPWETTANTTADPWETTANTTADPWETTGPVTTEENTNTTVDQWETTVGPTEATTEQTTDYTETTHTTEFIADLISITRDLQAYDIEGDVCDNEADALKTFQEAWEVFVTSRSKGNNPTGTYADVTGLTKNVTITVSGSNSTSAPQPVANLPSGKFQYHLNLGAVKVTTTFYDVGNRQTYVMP